jgi:putative endonuclease
LYCGITSDIKGRLIEHNSGKGAKYTRSRRPVELVGVGQQMPKSEALKLEYRIKQLPPSQKIFELTRKENEMTVTKRDLQSLQRQIKAIEQKLNKLIATAEKIEKPRSAKKAPAKKTPVKKKTAQPTATDQVLKIIKRSKKGVNAATLMTKTGFDLKKVRNILQRIYKQGKIKRVEKGIYMCA